MTEEYNHSGDDEFYAMLADEGWDPCDAAERGMLAWGEAWRIKTRMDEARARYRASDDDVITLEAKHMDPITSTVKNHGSLTGDTLLTDEEIQAIELTDEEVRSAEEFLAWLGYGRADVVTVPSASALSRSDIERALRGELYVFFEHDSWIERRAFADMVHRVLLATSDPYRDAFRRSHSKRRSNGRP
jgi:hypothetical protein